jgi:hypothetical protein
LAGNNPSIIPNEYYGTYFFINLKFEVQKSRDFFAPKIEVCLFLGRRSEGKQKRGLVKTKPLEK